ncbi:hypothetical protein FRT60_03170 [Pseudomonas haemolytica]|uniref:Uncharacterized protein n=1 Tax=Pseudomonas haemolytica TaxID=2600065 RepID=A0A646NT52_9PSED|nr:hypothetical protein [Pseudomonas haemolytica]
MEIFLNCLGAEREAESDRAGCNYFFQGVLEGLFASKPAPTLDRVQSGKTPSNVGAGLLAKAIAQPPQTLRLAGNGHPPRRMLLDLHRQGR